MSNVSSVPNVEAQDLVNFADGDEKPDPERGGPAEKTQEKPADAVAQSPEFPDGTRKHGLNSRTL
jgi:hypothetical protein